MRLTDKKTFDFFVENLGDAGMPSRVTVKQLAQRAGVVDVLDVGCGPALDRWEGTGIAWKGVDASRVLVDHNAARGVNITHAPAHALPFIDRSADLVYSRHVWEHLPDFLPALREMCRVADRFACVTFFRPPGKVSKVNVIDGAYYNDYSLDVVKAAFLAEWPNAQFQQRDLPPAKYLPDGELILFVERQ